MVIAETETQYPPIDPYELIFGLVYGAGAEAEPFERDLEDALQHYGYSLRRVHLSDYLPHIVESDEAFSRDSPDSMRRLQDMGDTLRSRTGQNDVLARLGVYLMATERAREATADGRVAWLLRSLKRREEVELLRRLYGPRFVLIALYVPDGERRRNVARRWQRWANVTSQDFEVEAARDVRRDEADRTKDHGQAVRDTFARADFFIDGRTKQSLRDTMHRAVHLIYGEPFQPPTRDEHSMYHAFAAGLRSSEMGRQVGAAIVNPTGDVLAVGTNDVPARGGGLYWSPDEIDGRDFAREPQLDSNTLWQRRVARELLVRMRETGWLNPRRADNVESGGYDVNEDRLDRFLDDVKPTRFSSLTEFGRAVHAEMDAITTAARNGVAISGATLFTTTFPCHNCTRHVIAAGLRRVVYIHPYAKSLAGDLHDDAVVVEPTRNASAGKLVLEQYIGVAPRVYPQFFGWDADRKGPRGRAMRLNPTTADPRVLADSGSFTFGGPTFPVGRTLDLERAVIDSFKDKIAHDSALRLPIAS